MRNELYLCLRIVSGGSMCSSEIFSIPSTGTGLRVPLSIPFLLTVLNPSVFNGDWMEGDICLSLPPGIVRVGNFSGKIGFAS